MPELDIELEKFRDRVGKALAEGGTQPLIQLTDEELAVLDPTALEEVVAPTPHLSGLDAQQREWALATALRSLVARGAVEVANIPELEDVLRAGDAPLVPGAEPPTADVDMRVTPDVDMAMVLRRTGDKALAVEQQTSRGSAYAFVYVHSKRLLLVEQVTAGGMHVFTLANRPGDAARMVYALLDPFGVAPERDGPVDRLDPSALTEGTVGGPLAETINNAMIVGQMIVLADQPGAMVTTYADDKTLWAVEIDAPQAPTGVTAQQLGEPGLVKLITRLVTPDPPAKP